MWETVVSILILIGLLIVGILLAIFLPTYNKLTENNSTTASTATSKTPMPTGLWEKEKKLLVEAAIKCGFSKNVVEAAEIEGMMKSNKLLVYKCRDSAYSRFYLIGNEADRRFFYLNGDMDLVECRERVCVRCGRMLSLEQAIANVREIYARDQEKKKQKEIIEKPDEEKQNEKEQKQMKFPKLEELRGYLSAKSTVRPLVVSHSKWGAGQTLGLTRNGMTEILTVVFMRIDNAMLVNKDFRFPDCFLQG